MKRIIHLLIGLIIGLTMQAQLDRSVPPTAGAAPKINIEEAKTFQLKNGLKVFVVENHKNPIVSYSLSLEIDPIVEGAKAGYISMAGDLLRSGTTTRTKAELDEAIDFIGATLSTSSRGIYASSLKKHSNEILDLMADVLYNPSFPADELEKLRKQSLTALQSSKDEPKAIAANVAGVLRYGKNHPYGEVMSEQTIEAITIDDCKNYYHTFFRPNVAYLVIVGDITLAEAKTQVNAHFKKWKKATVPSYKYDKPATYASPKVALSNKDAANQSSIQLTYTIDLTPNNPDVIKAKVMNEVLGGGTFSARLLTNLREDKAYTYGAYSSLKNDELVGYFAATSSVRTSVTDSAFTQIIFEMNRLKTEKVSDEDLKVIKNLMAGSFSRSLEDPKTVARFALDIQKYKLPKDYYQTYLKKLDAVTADDVLAMAQKYLKPENAIILAVGDVSKIKSSMKVFSTDGQVSMYDFYGNEVKSLPLPSGLTAQAVVNNYLTAIGGVEKLKTVNDIVLKGTVYVQGMELSMTTYSVAPNKQCVEAYMQGNLLSKQVYNGVAGKMESDMMGNSTLEGDVLANMHYQAQLFPELMFATEGFKLNLIGAEDVEGQEAYKIEITNPLGNLTTAYYSRETGLKIKEVSDTPMGLVSSRIEKYMTVDGILFPAQSKQTVAEQTFTITINSIKVNGGVEASRFDM